MEKFDKTVKLCAAQDISDIHLMAGQGLVYRKRGTICFDQKTKWTNEELNVLAKEVLNPLQQKTLVERNSVDFAISVGNIRLRINIFSTIKGLAAAVRLLPGQIPSVEDLNLHPSLKECCDLKAGLILICGATGSGKSTTMAAMIEEINKTRPTHIITLEDPIEYRFISKKSLVGQRELNTHVPSYEQGLLDVLREDPDVIVIGELREPETIRLTLHAAESGHLVIASLHASTPEDAIHRICNSFSPETQDAVRSQLSSTIQLLAIQQLAHYERAGFRLPILSIMRASQSIKGLIRENKLGQIESAIQTGKAYGMYTIESYKREFLDKKANFISPSRSFKPPETVVPEADSAQGFTPSAGMRIKVEEPRPQTGIPVGISQQPVQEEQTVDLGCHYVIDEQASMDQLISEIKKSGKY